MSDTPKIELIQGEIASVSLKPGDRLVLMFKERVTPERAAELQHIMERWVFMYRNALVVHARAVDRVKESEKKLEISTSDSDELLEEIQEILRDLGDQRDLFAVLEMERNGEAVENKPDPRQLEIAPPDGDEETKGKFADALRRGRAKIPRAGKPKRPVD